MYLIKTERFSYYYQESYQRNESNDEEFRVKVGQHTDKQNLMVYKFYD